MIEHIVSYLKQEVPVPLRNDSSLSLSTFARIETAIASVEKPLEMLYSKYRQDDFFAKHPLFIAVETVPLGFRYEMQSGLNRLVYDTYEYVSVEKKSA